MNITAAQTPEATAAYLRTLPAIRERCQRVFELGKEGSLQHFTYHPDRESDVVKFCIGIIQRDFGTNYSSIPPHGRWRHFDVEEPRIQPLIDSWKASGTDNTEIARRVVELSLVSVLLDAGAGPTWRYKEERTGKTYGRSEGLAVASLDMYAAGFFSGKTRDDPWRVDTEGLSRASERNVGAAMQVDSQNAMEGLTGRSALLSNLGLALQSSTEFFGKDARAGNIVDFLAKESKDGHVHVFALWAALMDGLAQVWPATRTNFGGRSLGDVWPCPALVSGAGADSSKGEDLVPFHKLTQWLSYSLTEPLERILGWKIDGIEDMTGLPEYRNGGLLTDFGVLQLRILPEDGSIPQYEPSHPAIVEWRAMTVILLDRLADAIRKELNEPGLTTAQILESATWKGGREIAKQKRSPIGGPPIAIISDGTVF
ncbi:DUF1688-domain-containing protein [Auriculariales sp. MPI-PUGE-AT-0066]|nr:DUF1688-domain-containing protein [Auriculariales sp. MPI-PUGE-AT-0066]